MTNRIFEFFTNEELDDVARAVDAGLGEGEGSDLIVHPLALEYYERNRWMPHAYREGHSPPIQWLKYNDVTIPDFLSGD